MKNKLKLFIGLFSLISCLTNCFQQHSLKIVSDDYCDSCNQWSGYYFYHRYYLEGKENCLDSALFLINEALSRCEEKRYDMSIRKLAVLCGKQKYDEAILFMDSISFAGQDYSCYKQVVFNRIHAMKYQYAEEIPQRNLYLQETVDLLHDYLSKNKLGVDSVWLNHNESSHDSLWLATLQYYHYFSILNGYKNSIKELDSLYDNHLMNEYCHERLVNESECAQLRLFLGI